MTVYNILGQNVATVINSDMHMGHHVVTFDATNLPSGMYIYKINVNGFSAQKKMMLMR